MFYSHVSNAIVAFPMIYEGEAVSQSRNLGSGEYYGAEASAAARLSPVFSLGATTPGPTAISTIPRISQVPATCSTTTTS
ncbi:hypothetical protein [Novosphingobium profundi]|uniref:hypothetical protein n=1 Tax=Novosphingobium profundi TaxID=1774954 RepID=UPI001CFCE871|nr:hypothetical protein [Novosphingobium profundi]